MRVLVACEFSGAVRDRMTARGHQAMSCDLLPCETPGLHYTGDVRHVLDGWMPAQFTAECSPDGEEVCAVSGEFLDQCQCLGPTQEGMEYREEDGVLFARPEDNPHWDLIVAHPPCTYLTSSGLHWNARGAMVDGRPRAELTEEALRFVQEILDAPAGRIALENPVGCISSRIRKPDQIIQPYEFGDDASKRTCLWLKNLPKLTPRISSRLALSTENIAGEIKRTPDKTNWGLPRTGGRNAALLTLA